MSISSNIASRLRLCLLLLFALAHLRPWGPAAAQNDAPEHLAVIFILDDSGSMDTSDPTDLRYTAAQLFVALLDEGDAAGAVRFSTNSTAITNGVEVIASDDDRTRLVQRLSPVPPEGFTDIKAAFENVEAMKAGFTAAGYQMVVILLTDGKPEIAQPYEAYEAEALRAARALGVPVVSIALTSAGQTPFLNRVAGETGGRVIFAREAADLLDSYLQILGDLKDRTVVGAGSTAAPAAASLPLDPALIPYVERVSFVVSKPAGVGAALVAPDGQGIAAGDPRVVFAIEDERFSVYTLQQPAGGDWGFELTGSGIAQARAILYSRLRVGLVAPVSAFEAGPPIPLVVRLVEEQPGEQPVTIIGQASFSALITLPDGTQDSLDQFYDDGTNGDAVAGDGLYSRLYANTGQPGNYHIQVQGFKGAVPVAYQTQLQAIAFPRVVVVEPAMARYDIRDNSVPLEVALTGADPAGLDHGGFVAVVTAPSGATMRVSLASDGARFSGTFQPREDGEYIVRFEPVEAIYQSLPFHHGAEASFSTHIVPTLAVQAARVGLQAQAGAETPRFELAQALLGIPVVVTITSSSPRTELVAVRLSDMPGFTLAEQGELAVPANGRTLLTLHLIGDAALSAGAFNGRLVFSAGEGVDVTGGEVPIALELFVPAVSVRLAAASLVSAASCLDRATVHLTLDVTSNSFQAEEVRVGLVDLPGAALGEQTIVAAPGNSQVQLTLKAAGGSFAAGDYAGTLTLAAVRPGVEMASSAELPLAFSVEPVWSACRVPLTYGTGGLLVASMLVAGMVVWARRRAAPPLVRGTLSHWNEAAPAERADVDLTALKKTEIRIGRAAANDVVIADDSVHEAHAVVLVERGLEDELRYTLRPLAPIRKGYRDVTSDLPLEENVEYRLGRRVIVFIPDQPA